MPERADALLALWNDVDPAREAAYNDWHAREHVPERLTVPGILWGLRYARSARRDGEPDWPRYLTLYGLRSAGVLRSAEYGRLLAEPTPASRAMRPALRNIARWVCSIDADDGIEAFRFIEVRTTGRCDPARRPHDAALLVATRLEDAAPLPWLSRGQASAVDGDRLLARAHEGDGCTWPSSVGYERLQVLG